MQFEISDGNIKISYTYHNKYNILAGDTAIGKTTMYDLISDSQRIPDIAVNSERDIIAVPLNDDDALVRYEDCILVLDENCKALHKPNTSKSLKDSKNYFVIITRKRMYDLPVALTDYCTIRSKGREYWNEPILSVPLQKSFNNIACVLTEDSDAGFQFFNRFIKTESMNGNTCILNNLKRVKANNSILLVFDASAIAMRIETFIEYIRKNNVQVLAWNSFENYLLSQVPFYKLIESSPCDYISLERYSTSELSKLVEYNKSELPDYINDFWQCDLKINEDNKLTIFD